MNPRTITGTLLAVVIVLQCVSLATVTQTTQTRLDDQAKLAAVHELDSKAKNLVIQAQQFLAPISSQLSISRQLIADGLLDTKNNGVLELYFLSQLRTNVAMNALYLGRFDGSYVAVSRFESSLLDEYQKPVLRSKVVSVIDGGHLIEWREYSLRGDLLHQWSDDSNDYDPRLLEWYKNAKTHDQPVWSNAYSLTNSDKTAIAASVNLRDAHLDDAGVLGVSVELSELNALLSAIPMSTFGSAVILDNNFNEVAASIPFSAHSEIDAANHDDPLPWASESAHRRLRSLLPPIEVHDNRLSAVDREWFSEQDTRANVQRRIQLFDGALQWRVILQSPVVALEQSHQNVVLDGMHRTMGIIILPGIIALLVICGLSEPLKRLHRRATIDYLTRALNREEFTNRFSKKIDDARLGNDTRVQWLGVALDLDGFKQINDQHGHDAGDEILKSVVARLQRRVGKKGLVGRLGGDEFAVALQLPHGTDARLAVEKIRQHVVKEPIKSANAIHSIGMTAGVALAREGELVMELLERADRALVTGKAVAKNATYCASDLEAEAALERRAVTQNRVENLISQPVYHTADSFNS